MTRAQYTVFGLLVAAAGLHIWLDSNAKSSFKQFLTITPNNWRQIGTATLASYTLWFVALAAMLLLADYMPRAATLISVLILTGAVLVNSDPIIAWLNEAEGAIAKAQPGATSTTTTTANAPD